MAKIMCPSRWANFDFCNQIFSWTVLDFLLGVPIESFEQKVGDWYHLTISFLSYYCEITTVEQNMVQYKGQGRIIRYMYSKGLGADNRV